MKIVVNTRLLRKNQMDGIGWFTFNTLFHIVKQNPQIEFHFLFDSDIDKEFLFADNIIPHKLFPPAKHAVLNILWFEYSVKRCLKKIKPDLFFSPDGILCLGWNGKQYGVIHDINFKHHPEYLKFSNRNYYNYIIPRSIKKASRIATVSEYSKQDICKTYNIGEKFIDVVYCGINSFFQPISEFKQIEIRQNYTGGAPYFIFIGAISPRKNIIGLIKAFEIFKERTSAATKLVIAGADLYKKNEVRRYRDRIRFGKDVIFTGRLDDSELNNVLASATALVFVPFFEGFGIPLIEAMQCDIPVISSNATSLPEIAGDAAIYVDPYKVETIAEAMMNIQQNENLRIDLINKGKQRREMFSWEKTSKLLWESLLKSF